MQLQYHSAFSLLHIAFIRANPERGEEEERAGRINRFCLLLMTVIVPLFDIIDVHRFLYGSLLYVTHDIYSTMQPISDWMRVFIYCV